MSVTKSFLMYAAVVFVICYAMLAPPRAQAQAVTAGQITGQVLDASKAAIPGATVTATNVATGAVRTAKTNAQGLYTLTDLPVGTYNVSAEHANFQRLQQTGVVLNAASTVQLNMVLSVGALSQEVVVSSQAPIINKTDASTGAVMNNEQVTELPINGRDYARFSLLTPGAIFRSNYIADLTFNGQQSVDNQFSIDGIDASRVDEPYMANGYERGARLLTGSLDTISEMNVESGDYNAQYGRAAGTYINIVTKSGTNQIHGEAYEFLRNDILDARNFFNTVDQAKPEFRYNDFGANVGGPIVKDKTFFFINYEGSRQRVGITGSGTVPSDYTRSQVLATSPQLAPIVDMFPVSTTPGPDMYTANYTTTGVSDVREDTASVRLDQKFSDSDSAFVRVNVNDSRVHGPLFGVDDTSLGVFDRQDVPIRTTNIAIDEKHIFGNSMVNDFLMGMQRWGSQIDSEEPWPQTSIVGYTVVPGTQGNYLSNSTSFQYGDTMSKVVSRHALSWGATIYRVQVNANSSPTSTMLFSSPLDFINDQVTQVVLVPASPGNGTRATQVGAFVNDTYRLRPTISLVYGLRYDIETVPHDSNYATQPFDTRLNALGPVGDPYFALNDHDFGPRVGIAWSPAQRFVVRSGFGVYFQDYPVGFGSYYVPANTVPGNTTLLESNIPTLTYPYTPFVSQGAALPPPNVNGFPWNKPDIYSMQWNLSVATQLSTNNAFQIAYVGNRGVNEWREEDVNYIDPTTGLRPNPNYGNIVLQTNTGFSRYNGLQASFTRRMGQGLLVTANYTFAHALGDVPDQGLFDSDPQNLYNIPAEYGNSSGDVRQSFNYSLLYKIPVGNGHRFLGSGIPSRMFSGWEVATLGSLQTGLASTVYIETNTYGNDDFINQRPNCVPGVSVYASQKSVNDWLNSAAFSMPAAGTYGNCPNGDFYGPSMKNIDFSLLKETKLGESRNLEFRAEFFNVFNHPNFSTLSMNNYYGTPDFGEMFDTLGATIGGGTNRQIQMALKFSF
ncbi:MAG: carboxypeptidase regulatory-like domain-containing protein [Candidatus Acidiferrales bacterium]